MLVLMLMSHTSEDFEIDKFVNHAYNNGYVAEKSNFREIRGYGKNIMTETMRLENFYPKN